MKIGPTAVNGRLSDGVVEHVFQENATELRGCYEQALQKEPGLSGRAVVKLVIDREGAVAMVGDGGSNVSGGVVPCVQEAVKRLRFPAPDSGVVTVVVPLTFAFE
jgi:hypothetical protein